MQNSMFQHITVTTLLVGLIYGAVIWANQDLFSEQAALWRDYTQTTEPAQIEGQNTIYAATNDKDPHQQSNNPSPEHTALATAAAGVAKDNTAKTDDFPSLRLTGVSSDVSLSDTSLMQQQVTATWQRFGEHAALQASVNWLKGSNTVYAYYYAFNRDFTTAKLLIGYASKTTANGLTSLNTKNGSYQRYGFNANGLPPDAAWQRAYPNGVILERYSVDINGTTSNQDVTVIF